MGRQAMMRLFVAVDFSAEAIEEATRVADEIRRRSRAPLRWVPSSNLHVTVRFIGHVAEDVDALITTVTAPVPLRPFDVALGACGAFPPSGAVRVVWIGLTAGSRELSELSGTMDDRLRPFGFEPEGRPFSPHLTIARAERHARVPRDLRDLLAHVTVRPIVTRVERAVLYRSHLSPKGPRYEPLAAIPLAGEPPGLPLD